MIVKSYCYSCDKESDTYANPKRNTIRNFCLQCSSKYTIKERNQRKIKTIFNIITEQEDK